MVTRVRIGKRVGTLVTDGTEHSLACGPIRLCRGMQPNQKSGIIEGATRGVSIVRCLWLGPRGNVMITRRLFLQSSAAACLATMAGAMTRDDRRRRALILIKLCGGMDGLHLVSPHGDSECLRRDGELGVRRSRCLIAGEAGQSWRFHEAAWGIEQLAQDGALSAVVRCGTRTRARGHMEAERLVAWNEVTECGWMTSWLERDRDSLVVTPGHPPLELSGAANIHLSSAPFALVLNNASWREDRWEHEVDRVRERASGIEAITQRIIRASLGVGGDRVDALDRSLDCAVRMLADGMPLRAIVLQDEGWDTHTDQEQALSKKFDQLSHSLVRFRSRATEAGVWGSFVVAVVSEFGRGTRVNERGGTEHGHATTALLVDPMRSRPFSSNLGPIVGSWGRGAVRHGAISPAMIVSQVLERATSLVDEASCQGGVCVGGGGTRAGGAI